MVTEILFFSVPIESETGVFSYLVFKVPAYPLCHPTLHTSPPPGISSGTQVVCCMESPESLTFSRYLLKPQKPSDTLIDGVRLRDETGLTVLRM